MGNIHLVRWRKASGLTHAELARRLGICFSAVGHLLAGRRRPSIAVAARIERLTGIPVRVWARGTPQRTDRYPKDWPALRRQIRNRSGGRCECEGECGLHRAQRCEDGDRTTAAHLNADGGPCRCDPLCSNPEHTKWMCRGCHLRYDAPRHAARMRMARERRASVERARPAPPPPVEPADDDAPF